MLAAAVPLRVGSNGAQGVGGDIEQHAVDCRFVVPGDGADGRGQCEHDVVVRPKRTRFCERTGLAIGGTRLFHRVANLVSKLC